METELSLSDLENLKITIANYNKYSLIKALDNTVSIYKSLRRKLYTENIILQLKAEKLSLQYLKMIKNKD